MRLRELQNGEIVNRCDARAAQWREEKIRRVKYLRSKSTQLAPDAKPSRPSDANIPTPVPGTVLTIQQRFRVDDPGPREVIAHGLDLRRAFQPAREFQRIATHSAQPRLDRIDREDDFHPWHRNRRLKYITGYLLLAVYRIVFLPSSDQGTNE